MLAIQQSIVCKYNGLVEKRKADRARRMFKILECASSLAPSLQARTYVHVQYMDIWFFVSACMNVCALKFNYNCLLAAERSYIM